MEGNSLNIPIKGIARYGSDQSCEDGLCNEMINLEFKDGLFVPVGFEDVLFSIQGTDIIGAWVHKTTNQHNIIYKKINNEFYWSKLPEKGGIITDSILLVKSDSDKIEIMNNLICIGNMVFLFSNGKYSGVNKEKIDFKMQLDVRYNGVAFLHKYASSEKYKDIHDEGETWEGTVAKRGLTQLAFDVEKANYLVGIAYMRYALKLYDGTYIHVSVPTLVSDIDEFNTNGYKNTFQPIGDINFRGDSYENVFESNVRMIGYLVNMGWKWQYKSDKEDDDFRKVYSENSDAKKYRLYDTNSMKSDETFFKEDIPFNKENTYCRNGFKTSPTISDLKKSIVTKIPNSTINEGNGFGTSSNILKDIGRIQTKPDVNDMKGWRVWYPGDNTAYTGVKENWFLDKKGQSIEDVVLNDLNFYNTGDEYAYGEKGLGIAIDQTSGEVKDIKKNDLQYFFSRLLSTPSFRIIKNLDKSLENIVVSVDVFMTKPVSTHKEGMIYSGGSSSNQREYKNIQEIKEELENSLANFYKIYEIPFDKLVTLETGSIYEPYIMPGAISAIEQQIRLDIEYPHVDRFKISHVYNNRLHIANLETYLNSNLFPSITPIRQLYTPDVPGMMIKKIYAKVTLKDNGSVYNPIFGMDWDLPTGYSELFYSIVYPDERAEAIEFLAAELDDNGTTRYFKMEGRFEFNQKNGYSIYQNLYVVTRYNLLTKTEITYDELPTVDIKIERNKNIFKVSSVNNMINFPLAQTYQVGNGEIIGFASSTRALSQGQFGQFPLYVFTTEGIYSMEVEPTGAFAYRSNVPISREVCSNPNTILELDGAVVFGTKKGLMILSGVEVAPFSEQVNGDINILPVSPTDNDTKGNGLVVYDRAISNDKLVSLYNSISTLDFRDYINLPETRLSYIYDKGKILVYNSNQLYAYLIDIATKTATKLSEQILFDDNNYPTETYATKDVVNGITNLNILPYTKDKSNTETMFITRPIKLGTYNFKSSYRVVLRGKYIIAQDKHAGLYVMGSQDCVNWMYLGGTEKSGEFTDIGTTIERYSVKYIIILFVGDISCKSKITGLEIDSNVKYNNKLR